MQRIFALAVCLGALAAASPAGAQPKDSSTSLDARGTPVKKPRPGVADVKPQPQTWTRLEAGAVLCRSEYDLDRLAQRRSGGVVEGPVDCQIIRAATGITIVQRKGPGRTEVKPSDSHPMESGWTDAWLPQKAPASATSAMR